MFAAIHSSAGSPFDCALDFSPLVERTSDQTVVIDVSGLRHLFGGFENIAAAIAERAAETGLTANVAVAANPDAAVHAARGIAGVTVIPPGREAEALGILPLDVLEPSERIASTLAMWGIRTFAQFAALPEDGVVERLGPEGGHLWKLAHGAGARPLVPDRDAAVFEESFELEYPVTLLEPLAFITGRILTNLCAKLESHGLAAHEIRVELRLERGVTVDEVTADELRPPAADPVHQRILRLPYPMRDARAFLKLVTLDLDMHPPGAPVAAVTIAMQPVNPRVVQHGLFVPLAPEPQKLELTLARLCKLVGEGNVGAAVILDTHRPGAFAMRRFAPPPAQTRPKRSDSGRQRLAIRVFRPPLAARVNAPMGRPVRVEAGGIKGNVVSSAGPWRTSGAWWREDPWRRDEWDVALADGGLYKLYRDHLQNRWFVEGVYD